MVQFRISFSALLGAAATVAALSCGGFGTVPVPGMASVAYAQGMRGPPGFADIVEQVKPAVVSVRVKIEETTPLTGDRSQAAPDESPFDRFFRQFGAPNNANPNGAPREQVTAQGSGFFISADGYVILEASGKKVTSPSDLTNAVQSTQKEGKRSVLLRVGSGNGIRYVTLPVGSG